MMNLCPELPVIFINAESGFRNGERIDFSKAGIIGGAVELLNIGCSREFRLRKAD